MVSGDATGDVLFYGKGAGKMPTASAVVADVIDCVKHLEARKYLGWNDGSPDYVADYREVETPVSYTHLDVYKRQIVAGADIASGQVDFIPASSNSSNA